ncbi:MAG: helix-turn-helix domain-containing protein [Candidatus Omnitrophota bacterium]|nr:helix-turn-helix domain-containing protein [Candidatus Omnitrophota bacterium]
MIKDLCYNLAEKRKKLGLTIEEVVEKTKLCPSVIHSIEEGDLTNISATYFRGFIKIYASFLGVTIAAGTFDTVSSVKTSRGFSGEKKDPFSRPKPFREVESKKIGTRIDDAQVDTAVVSKQKDNKSTEKEVLAKLTKNIKPFIVGGIILFVLFMFTKFVIGMIFKPREKPVVSQVQKESNSSSFQEKSKIISSPGKDNNLSDTIDVSLEVKKDCFVRVKVDGNLLFEGILNKGTVEMWKGTKEIEFKISDGSAVYLEVNGKPIPPLTAMRKPIKSLRITHSGISVDK